MREVTLKDLANSFGDDYNKFSKKFIDKFNSVNLNYEYIQDEDLEKLYIKIIDRLFSDNQKIGAFERTEVWEKGWGENLNDFLSEPNNENTLIPKFIRPGLPIRFFQKFIRTENPMFELEYFKLYRQWLFEKYLKEYDHIYEFGCGTGFNLLEGCRMYKDKRFYGSDFVSSSVKLVNEISKKFNLKLESELFDFVKPNYQYEIKENSLVSTFGALEQIKSKFLPFIDFLRKKRPGIIIHTEPVKELYHLDNFNDYTAFLFHSKRGYTEGLLPYLQELEKKDEIEILKVKRLFFGSLMMEGFNLIVWRFK